MCIPACKDTCSLTKIKDKGLLSLNSEISLELKAYPLFHRHTYLILNVQSSQEQDNQETPGSYNFGRDEILLDAMQCWIHPTYLSLHKSSATSLR